MTTGTQAYRAAVLASSKTISAIALRTGSALATAAPVAAGPVLFERLDWRPYGVRTSTVAAGAPSVGV